MNQFVKFDDRTVTIGDNSWMVKYPIHDLRVIGGLVLVLYEYTSGPRGEQFHNLEAFDHVGRKVWTAEHPTTAAIDAYVEFQSDEPLRLWSFACFTCVIDPETGKLIESIFTK